LQSGDREERLKRLAQERNPWYEELADVTFPSQSRSLEAAAKALYQAILSHQDQRGDSINAELDKTRAIE
jgi:shikimate kinase